MVDDDVRSAYLYLSAVAERPTVHLWDLIDEVGAVDAAALVRAGSVNGEVQRQTSARRGTVDLEAVTRAGESAGGRFIVPGDSDWPAASLAALDSPRESGLDEPGRRRKALADVSLRPLGLWWSGPADPQRVTDRSAAIVGSRAPSAYGKNVAADVAFACALEEIGVVSGAAFGVDTAAHKGCLTAEGVTVAVLACGIDNAYPRANENLLRAISRSGAVVSPYPPGTTVARYRFLDRNRLIAALSRATIVVEAGARSGALSTAAWARNLGRPVGAVPGPVTSAMSVGTHRLLRETDAVLVRGGDDVVELAGTIGEGAEETENPSSGWDHLDDQTRRVLEAVPVRGEAGPGEIAASSGVAVETVRITLGRLLADGLVDRGSVGFSRDTAPPGQLRLV